MKLGGLVIGKFVLAVFGGVVLMSATPPSSSSVSAPASARQVAIPAENASQGPLPDMAPADSMSRRILEAVMKDQPEVAREDFFPEEPFLALKAMPGAANYYKQLVREYETALHREHARVKGLLPAGQTFEKTPLEFVRYIRGGCRWKAPGAEYNAIAYHSCFKNRIEARLGEKTIEVPVRVVINWGSRWYVTHK
jgi:hypothetical protein